MILTNLDIIVRGWLLQRNIPIHFYAEGLYHSCNALSYLTQDTLQVINAANLPVSDYGGVDLPDDFVDDLGVFSPVSGSLAPLPKQDWITPLRIHDTTSGEFVPYPGQENTSGLPNVFYGFPMQWNYYWNVNDYGEATGRRFGSRGGTAQGYQVFKERRQLQLTPAFYETSIVLLYISDGQSSNAASQIDTMATRAIQTWIDWQRSPNATIKDSMEARTFYNEKRRLKSLLNPLTKTDILNTIRNSYTSSIKT